MERSFSEWSKVSALKFKLLDKNGDMKVLFAPGNHLDGYPFDGQGGVLAHVALKVLIYYLKIFIS